MGGAILNKRSCLCASLRLLLAHKSGCLPTALHLSWSWSSVEKAKKSSSSRLGRCGGTEPELACRMPNCRWQWEPVIFHLLCPLHSLPPLPLCMFSRPPPCTSSRPTSDGKRRVLGRTALRCSHRALSLSADYGRNVVAGIIRHGYSILYGRMVGQQPQYGLVALHDESHCGQLPLRPLGTLL